MSFGGNEYYVLESPEWLRVITDSEGRIIAGIKPNGATYIAELEGIDIDSIKQEIQEYLEEITQNIKDLNDTFEYIDDVENRTEVKLDASSRIISYRKDDGTLVENAGIETNHLELTAKGMTEFQQALKDSGFNPGGAGDWTDSKEAILPKPEFAFINIYNETKSAVWPQMKGVDLKYYMEFYDGIGNYFKKEIITNAQGNSSLMFPKKNAAIDICNNNDWDDEDTFKIKFGNWVSQDSFHIKSWYIDAFRGKANVSYRLMTQIMNHNEYKNQRPWHKLQDEATTIYNGTGVIMNDLNAEPLGVPDGFPAMVYLNGDFYGIFTVNLKKHRDNYAMKKNNKKHIHIDGDFYGPNLFSGSTNINWSKMEIRNPKGLIDINGNKYDGDNPTEITGDSEVSATSAYVKGCMQRLSNSTIDIAANPTKETFENYFDVRSCIDYLLQVNFLHNPDSIQKNTQWVTYDGKIWYPMAYDHDQVFGGNEYGNHIRTPEDYGALDYIIGVDDIITHTQKTPFPWVFQLYKDEMDARYKELVDAGILTVENVMGILSEWVRSIGLENYEKDFEKWPETPSYRNSSGTYVNTPTTGGYYESVCRVEKYLKAKKEVLDVYFNF